MFRIPLSYNPIDHKRLNRMLASYANKPHGQLLDDFERKLEGYTGAKHVVALNSGTAAIHLGLMMLGVGKGDLVLVSSFTYVGSINPILYLGAKPVFIDAEQSTGNMDPDLLETALQDLQTKGVKPKAIIVVHSYGIPARMDKIMTMATRHEVPVLEDAAEAIGTRYKGRHVGTFGAIGILSFNNNKLLTTYGGGAIMTNNTEYREKILFLSGQAREDKTYYEHLEVGYSYRMGPVNAATGLVGLEVLAENLIRRRRIYHAYQDGLRNSSVQVWEEQEGMEYNHWLVLLDFEKSGLEVEDVRKNLQKRGIEARNLWKPMHQQPVFQTFSVYLNSVSERFFKTGLCLPTAFNKEPDLEVIIAGLRALLTKV